LSLPFIIKRRWRDGAGAELRAQRVGGDSVIVGCQSSNAPIDRSSTSQAESGFHLVREIEELIPFELSFQANGVQVHIPQ